MAQAPRLPVLPGNVEIMNLLVDVHRALLLINARPPWDPLAA